MSDKELMHMLKDELRQGFSLLSGDIQQTNSRLEKLGAEVTTKLDGITTLLLRYDKDAVRLEDRIDKIEDRVDDIERKQRPA